MNEGTVICVNIRNIDIQLRRDFKALCAASGTDMTAALVAYMEKCVRDGRLVPQR